MTLFSYVVARDYGFAPNPFFGVCTLATCKPEIRRHAQVNDWILGTGSTMRGRDGFLVYAMRVTEIMTFDEYWRDPRFELKKPNLRGSKKQAFGDNIYRRNGHGPWQQLDSHHSNPDGSKNVGNVANDTQTNRILLSTEFVYFGGTGPKIPKRLRDYQGHDLCGRRGHKNRFPEAMVQHCIDWLRTLGLTGYRGEPLDWKISP